MAISGVLPIDKPAGPTSHDVVARVRKKLAHKKVGHAGTLDPMATGLLLVLLGEATKLEPWLVAAEKAYVAEVELGRSTKTLDADGETTVVEPVSEELLAELAALEADPAAPTARIRGALDRELARTEQIPPAFSAIHVDGVRSYVRARAGRDVELPPRPVRLLGLRVVSACKAPPRLRVELIVSKGYYVRSFARDLGEALGVASHLAGLRRTRSSGFDVGEAASVDAPKDELIACVIPVEVVVAKHLPIVRLDEDDVRRAGFGQPIALPASSTLAPGDRAALFAAAIEKLVAIGEVRPVEGEVDLRELVILRGFRVDPP